ncbi:MAG: hypothetical protein KF774_17895 [Planctomyces sp.]|nr:hypothetical protein [Planctomyces sp.]
MIRVKDEAAGRKGQCKGCGETITVPAPRRVRATPAPEPPKTAPELAAIAKVDPPAGMPTSKKLGLASLALGGGAILISCVPFFGLLSIPMNGLGIMVGMAGIYFALMRKQGALWYSIAGTLICTLDLIFTLLVMAALVALPFAAQKSTLDSMKKFDEALIEQMKADSQRMNDAMNAELQRANDETRRIENEINEALRQAEPEPIARKRRRASDQPQATQTP